MLELIAPYVQGCCCVIPIPLMIGALGAGFVGRRKHMLPPGTDNAS